MGNWQVSEVELSYKSKVSPSILPQIEEAEDAYKILMQHWDMDKIDHIEQAKVLLLSHSNKVLAIYGVSTGGWDMVIIDSRVIFSTALLIKASFIILAHNHPSGELKPSDSDVRITSKLVKAGDLLQIKVLDHLIVTCEGFLSFAEKGLI